MPLLAQISTSQVNEAVLAAERQILRLQMPAPTSSGSTEALIHNLSEYGLLIETEAALQEGDTLEVDLPEAGITVAVVVWTRFGLAGCEFQRPVSTGVVSSALNHYRQKGRARPSSCDWTA